MRLTAGVAGETLALAGGGVVRQQRVLLVVAVYGAGGDDVVLVLIHQRQLGVVIYCSEQGGRQAQRQRQQPGTKQPWNKHSTFKAATRRPCGVKMIQNEILTGTSQHKKRKEILFKLLRIGIVIFGSQIIQQKQ